MCGYYYAVRKGFRPGVYPTWNELMQQIAGYHGADYKIFDSSEEAWKFVLSSPN
ncbi:uncharacterized protein ASCRUDRAFT_75087 [Ascoidea rubescens DSM 1968]|uniref:ribonuclease H n=1 Tax=Ascoidea rubescens DSM 1968 TaxID=1344418 RepID=A0A1D2VJM0_9ASCO|nr:hypothetical protein ASCRUDRAFT_75087 [Ascoidea rubescens DSM 1968]ODV61811.1 hypothetical protein ASCRUDRAFT_75087 [Ascoidea rubescens DSM 1968]